MTTSIKLILLLGMAVLLLVFLYPARQVKWSENPGETESRMLVNLNRDNGPYLIARPPRVFLFSSLLGGPVLFDQSTLEFTRTLGKDTVLLNVEINTGRVVCEAGLILCLVGFTVLLALPKSKS